MVIVRTPFRMSFVGGGTDFVEFFQEYGGAVLSTTIDRYCYVTVRHLPFFSSTVRKFAIRRLNVSVLQTKSITL